MGVGLCDDHHLISTSGVLILRILISFLIVGQTLCNACGIRYRKRKMADANPNPENKSEKPLSSSSSSSNPTGGYDDHDHHQMNESLKKRISDLGKQMIVQRSSSPSSQLKRQRSDNSSKKKLGEVEQAAALLMSLSCGSVFA